MSRLKRWWHVQLLKRRGWPDPECAIDWLAERQRFLDD